MHSTLDQIKEVFQAASVPQQVDAMKAYMKGHFEFYGIKSERRREISKPFLAACKNISRQETLMLAKSLWKCKERELHYLALELLLQNYKKNLSASDIIWMEEFVTNNSWWDSVDVIAPKLMFRYFKEFPAMRDQKVDAWIASGNIWLIRSALLFQLKQKKETDLDFLFATILRVCHTREFFINKAIGWVLRENAKRIPSVIFEFVNQNQNELSDLSQREALKHFKN